MQDEHRQAIQNNFISLVEQTDLDIMVSALYEKGVFSEQMIEPFKDTNKDARTKKRQLYTVIPRRGPEAFGHLLEALEENGYWNLVRQLDPASSLHRQQPRSTYNNQGSKSGESNYVSIRTEREKTKPKVENSKKSNFPDEVQANPAESGDRDTTDPSVEIPYFHVVKSKQFYDDTTDKDIKPYRTRRRERGILVIFSYMQFRNDIEKYRRGVDIDCNKLKYLFDEIGFSVIAYQNLTKEETETTLKRLKEVLVGTECVFIVVSSHGYERGSDTDIRCSDGKLISLLAIIKCFSNANLPALRGVPKVFISQLCRGRNEDWVMVQRQPILRLGPTGEPGAGAAGAGSGSAHVESDGARWDEQLESHFDRFYSDILIAHSTVPGFVSHRDPEKGSWYIQALCEVFAARAHDCDVEKLFTLVDERMYAQFHVQTSSVEKWAFNRRLFLHPGLYEN